MEDTRFMRTAALWCAAGGVLPAVLGGVIIVLADLGVLPRLPDLSVIPLVPRQVLFAVFQAMSLAGLVGLARSGATGSSATARVALGSAMLGQALLVLGELLVPLHNQAISGALFGLALLLNSPGMVVVGIIVLRTKRWQGWHAFTPLLRGLYAIVVLIPAFVLIGGNGLVLLGYDLCYLPLSVALWQEASGHQAVQPAMRGNAA